MHLFFLLLGRSKIIIQAQISFISPLGRRLDFSKWSMMTKCHRLNSLKTMSTLHESLKRKTLYPISRSSWFSAGLYLLKETGTCKCYETYELILLGDIYNERL